MKRKNDSSRSLPQKDTPDFKWLSSNDSKRQQDSFIRKASKIANTVNESRQIPASTIKEPFTV